MPYPTDVTHPRLGADAFAENDAASQLAQAAFLLLLGNELRRSRGRLMRTGWTLPSEPDEDGAAFGMPRIDGSGRRYRARDARALGVPLPSPRERDATGMFERSRELAYRLQGERREDVAAALLHVCVARPDPIVRVAAAAAGIEITAEPARLIAILAKGTRDEDPLVRDLSATALARVYPDHSALRRLTRRWRRKPGGGVARTSLVVHGTFARNQTWWQPGGDFHAYALANVLPDLYAEDDRFEWSGGYSHAARLLAADDLRKWSEEHAVADPLVIGHSHGANVLFLATQFGVGMLEAVLLSCPVRWEYAPDFSRVPKLVSVRVRLDLVILADGGGQRFDDPRISENVLPVWFNHSATHDPAIWQEYDVPAMLAVL